MAECNLNGIEKREKNKRLASEITQLAGQINAATYRFLKLLAEFDNNLGWSGDGATKSCAHWLNYRCGIALGAARERIRVAHCLEELPETNRAFGEGEISYSMVRAMTRIADDSNEDFLLMIARHGTASHMEQTVRKYQFVKRLESKNITSEQQAARELVYYEDTDGMLVIHARLPAEAGAMVKKALDDIVAKLDKKHVPAETHCSEVVTPGQAHGVDSDEDVRPTFPQKRADAVAALAEHYFATSGFATKGTATKGFATQGRATQGSATAGPASANGAERCQLMLHIDLATLKGAARSPTHHCELDGSWIPAETAKRLACDAAVIAVIEDSEGNVLNIGRRSRTIPPSIRRALKIRDNGCRFPGCCESRYVDAHHVQHWADGGETTLNNLITLCRHHHSKLHEEVYSITAHADATFTFIAADGSVIEPAVYPQFTASTSATETETDTATLKTLFPHIDENTAISNWLGDTPDYQLVMGGLLQRQEKHVPAETRRLCLGRDPLSAEQRNRAVATPGWHREPNTHCVA